MSQDEDEIRLREELNQWIENKQDAFKRADFIRDLFEPIEVTLPLPAYESSVTMRFCRLTETEVERCKQLAEESKDEYNEVEAAIWMMVSKAQPEMTFEEVKEFFMNELPSEVSGGLGNLIVAQSSVFFTKARKEQLMNSFTGSILTQRREKTQS